MRNLAALKGHRARLHRPAVFVCLLAYRAWSVWVWWAWWAVADLFIQADSAVFIILLYGLERIRDIMTGHTVPRRKRCSFEAKPLDKAGDEAQSTTRRRMRVPLGE